MNRRAIQLILVAALVAIAGCAGGMGRKPAEDPTADNSRDTIDSSGETGTVAFYVSDEPSQIDDFRHLNVTITKVGFKKTGDAADGASGETDDGDGGAPEGHWVEYDVDERAADLTELKGANATMIDEFDLPAGEYETVFIHISDTEGVLTDGSETNVTLPSNKLQLHTTFTIGNNEPVDFVYDIAPHKAGKSGTYILKPVISQSGTGSDVEIRVIDEENEAGEKEEKEGEKRTDEGTGDVETDNSVGNGDAIPEEKPMQD
ncbi:DUF4382 domain-containing protein [Natrinema gelatinilyticum]|uniref:DUF4382 domain-containing protein n=1 Tax=Natrinema gelatinilyticum TaxID=2961571 RepID=UPI0020C23B29|nr:DUF4382 domain-containing protein [Natrinema gelatinilyticum]